MPPMRQIHNPVVKQHQPLAGELANSDVDFETQALGKLKKGEGEKDASPQGQGGLPLGLQGESVQEQGRSSPPRTSDKGKPNKTKVKRRASGIEYPAPARCARCTHLLGLHYQDHSKMGGTDECHALITSKEPCECQSFLSTP